MTLANISGNPDSLVNSMLGDGYANGVSAGGGFTAVESPFGGIIAISGKIAHQIGNPAPPEKVKYKVQFKKIGGTWKDIRDDFRIWMRVDGLPSGFVDQSADDNGYFGYLTDDADSSSPPMLEVQDDILAIWHTPVADGDGLYLLRLLVFSHGAPAQADVPAEHLASNTVKIMIDNSKPVASITLDTGPCREFSHGDAITGRLTATGHHLWRYSIDVLPALGPDLPGVSPAHGQYPVLPSTGFTNRPFAVSTDRETAAGEYVLRLSVTDRTIVNNTFPGISTSAEVQFCLLKVEQEGDDRQG